MTPWTLLVLMNLIYLMRLPSNYPSEFEITTISKLHFVVLYPKRRLRRRLSLIWRLPASRSIGTDLLAISRDIRRGSHSVGGPGNDQPGDPVIIVNAWLIGARPSVLFCDQFQCPSDPRIGLRLYLCHSVPKRHINWRIRPSSLGLVLVGAPRRKKKCCGSSLFHRWIIVIYAKRF